MKITTKNLEILKIPADRIYPDTKPLEHYSRYLNTLGTIFDNGEKFNQDLIGLLVIKLGEANNIHDLQLVVTDLSNFLLKQVENLFLKVNPHEDRSMSAIIEQGTSKPDPNIIRTIVLLFLDIAHDLVYGQKIPDLSDNLDYTMNPLNI